MKHKFNEWLAENHPGNAANFGGAPAPEPQEDFGRHRAYQAQQGQQVKQQVLHALARIMGNPDPKNFGGSFTGEALRQIGGLDDQTIKMAFDLGILVQGDQGHPTLNDQLLTALTSAPKPNIQAPPPPHLPNNPF